MSSFNSQYNSVPISVTPILPFPLLSSPFFSAPISLFIFPPWSYINQHTHVLCLSPLLSIPTLILLFSKVLPLLHLSQNCFFLFCFCEICAIEVNSYTVFFLSSSFFRKKKHSPLLWVSCNLDRFQQGHLWSHPVTMERFHPQPPRVTCFAL